MIDNDVVVEDDQYLDELFKPVDVSKFEKYFQRGTSSTPPGHNDCVEVISSRSEDVLPRISRNETNLRHSHNLPHDPMYHQRLVDIRNQYKNGPNAPYQNYMLRKRMQYLPQFYSSWNAQGAMGVRAPRPGPMPGHFQAHRTRQHGLQSLMPQPSAMQQTSSLYDRSLLNVCKLAHCQNIRILSPEDVNSRESRESSNETKEEKIEESNVKDDLSLNKDHFELEHKTPPLIIDEAVDADKESREQAEQLKSSDGKENKKRSGSRLYLKPVLKFFLGQDFHLYGIGDRCGLKQIPQETLNALVSGVHAHKPSLTKREILKKIDLFLERHRCRTNREKMSQF